MLGNARGDVILDLFGFGDVFYGFYYGINHLFEPPDLGEDFWNIFSKHRFQADLSPSSRFLGGEDSTHVCLRCLPQFIWGGGGFNTSLF